jgi:hypothetical protein
MLVQSTWRLLGRTSAFRRGQLHAGRCGEIRDIRYATFNIPKLSFRIFHTHNRSVKWRAGVLCINKTTPHTSQF